MKRNYANRKKRAPIPAERRFWRHVLIVPGVDCWLWIGADDGRSFGYGRFVVNTAKRPAPHVDAHRYSYEMANGPVPEGLFVCHRCDVPKCVRPSHLFTGTASDNVLDCKAKGRNRGHVPGQHPKAKLDNESARAIYESKEYDFILAARHGVSRSTVSAIRRGETWKHIHQKEVP